MSYFLFALVILGNTTYGLSVLLKNPDQGQGERSYLIHHLPWLIGSLGTLTLDLVVSFKEKKTWLLGLWALLNPTYMLHFTFYAELVKRTFHQMGLGLMTACVETQYIVSKVQTLIGKLACHQQRNSVEAALAAPGGHASLFTPQKWWTEVKVPGESFH